MKWWLAGRVGEHGDWHIAHWCQGLAQSLDALDLMHCTSREIRDAAVRAGQHRDVLDDDEIGPAAEAPGHRLRLDAATAAIVARFFRGHRL